MSIQLTSAELDRFLAKQRNRHVEALEESLARKIDHLHDDGEKAIDYCKKLIGEGADVSEELRELKELGLSLALMMDVLGLVNAEK